MGLYLKDPGAALDYAVEWGGGYLGARTVAASAWSVAPDEPGGVAVMATVTGATRTAATIEGGVPGRVYRVTNRVTLSDGSDDERSLALRVEQR